MSTTTKQDIENMNITSLQSKAEEIRRELFLLRMKKFSAPEKNTRRARILRKDLARTLTFLKQREMHG